MRSLHGCGWKDSGPGEGRQIQCSRPVSPTVMQETAVFRTRFIAVRDQRCGVTRGSGPASAVVPRHTCSGRVRKQRKEGRGHTPAGPPRSASQLRRLLRNVGVRRSAGGGGTADAEGMVGQPCFDADDLGNLLFDGHASSVLSGVVRADRPSRRGHRSVVDGSMGRWVDGSTGQGARVQPRTTCEGERFTLVMGPVVRVVEPALDLVSSTGQADGLQSEQLSAAA